MSPVDEPTPGDPPFPPLAARLLALLLPHAEREEVLLDLEAEHRERVRTSGRGAARRWAWRQVLASLPALASRGWWRGWSGFEPRSNRWKPGGAMFESWGRDLKYVLRRLRARPTYAVLTVMTLALGVAGSSGVFAIARQLLLEPLPVRAEEEVVNFWMEGSWSEAEFLALRPEIHGFESLAQFRQMDVPMQPDDGPARLIPGAAATAEFFQVLGVNPALGAGFRPGDDRPDSEPVVVLSHSLWRELGADRGIIGSRLELAGVKRTVVGVMPRGFWFPDPSARIWIANPVDEDDFSGNWGVIGRLSPGRTAASMEGELDRLMAWMHERFAYPEGEWDKRVEPTLTPLRDRLVGELRPAVIATLAAMAAILLIACVNVSALMLGQVESRDAELAVRSALGAERRQLIGQLAVEALTIGALAGVVGAVLATVGFRFLLDALPLGALAESATIDWPLFAAAMAIALTAAAVVALAPGISVARGDLQRSLTRARTGGIAGRGGRFESGLVVAQVGLVLLMVASAGLLIRSVRNLRAIDPGIRVEGLAVIDLVLPTTIEPARRSTVVRGIVEAVDALPGTRSVASAQMIPLRGSGNNWGIQVEGREVPDGMTTAFRPVTPGYLETMGVEVRSGRMLRESDRDAAVEEGVVVINQALADQLFPGEDPLGRRIAFMNRWDRIVGVVGNVAEAGLEPDPVPTRYMTHEQVPWLLPIETLVVRMEPGRTPASLLDAARRAIQSTAPTVAIQETTTMERVLDRAIGPARQVMTLLTLLGVLALALGTIGVYGVVSHFVSRRRREWGIRLALGMRPERVRRRILRQGGALVGAGVALGGVGFLLLARLLASFLYGVGAGDPASLAGATGVLVAAGLLAAYLPARRASRIDPALVLREQ